MRLLIATMILALVGAAGLWADARQLLNAPLRIDGDTAFTIAPGQAVGGVIDRMADLGWLEAPVRSTLYLRLYARHQKLATRIKAGEYRLSNGMSAVDALRLFVEGRTILYQVRLIEGWTLKQALAELAKQPQLEITLADAGDPVAAMDRTLGLDGRPAEGRLFPDTYHFPKGTQDVVILRRAYEKMQRVLDEEWANRAEGLPYASPDEALVMASIIEKETGAPQERAQIAGVFVRRLLRGMRLQTDPTVIYGLGDAFDGNLRRRDLLQDTPYNTYTRGGLPPTPICLPGRASIHAALHPDDGNSLFFVSRGDGTHVFSETLDQHEAAVRKYQLKR
ncbi:MAG: endolytic transglycosylase MltG [Nevskiales bacterium]|nr:endolytic transglycosylase MltG [Nevskiales bacterium]